MMRVAISFIIGLTWATAATAQVASAPPPVAMQRVAPAPPIVSVRSYAPSMSADRVPVPVTPVVIRMTMGNQTLWSGPLNIGGRAQARISLVEPVGDESRCNRTDESRLSRQIELSINAVNYRPTNSPDYRLSARFSRPSEGIDCPTGTRTVSIDQSFSLDGRKSLNFEGDGGLKIQITLP